MTDTILANTLSQLKSEFDSLWKSKLRGETIEIITPFTTIDGSFISVFITQRDNHMIVADGARLTELLEDPNCAEYKTVQYFRDELEISETRKEKEADTIFYKRCAKQEMLPVAVYDLALFISSCVNHHSYLQSKKEIEYQARFASKASDFIKQVISDIPTTKELTMKRSVKLDDVSARFTSVVYSPDQGRMLLISCITGSNKHYFGSSMNKAIVNMELSYKSKYAPRIDKRFSIIDDESNGFSEMNMAAFNLLSDKLTHEPIRWEERDQLSELITF